MTDPSINFTELESQRVRLEENVAGLRKSLQYWQTWEAEYEGLKEEIIALGEDYTPEELEEVGVDFGGTLLNEKEIQFLLKDARGKPRESQQIVGLLNRRNDYVLENVRAMSRRLERAEEQLGALKVRSQPKLKNAEGLPITEILEELDEESNVISSSTTRPGEAVSQVADALRKAGLEEEFPTSQTAAMLGLDDAKRPLPGKRDSVDLQGNHDESLSAVAAPHHTDESADQTSLTMAFERAAPEGPQKLRKKSVTFTDDTKGTAPRVGNTPSSNESEVDQASAARPMKSFDRTEYVPDATSKSIDEDEPHPVIPSNESFEDAALRRQMLQYSMNEVAAVVAEIDLDESGSQTSYSDDEDQDEHYASSADEEEDSFGRTTRRVLSDDYLREMQELERKLDARVMQNIGPTMPGIEDDREQPTNDTRPPKKLLSSTTHTAEKKGVRFADELDISPAPLKDQVSASEPAARPVHEAVVERTDPSSGAPPSPTNRKKVSRFKSSRHGAPAAANGGNPLSNSALTNSVASGPLRGDTQEGTSIRGSSALQLTPAAGSKLKPFSEPIRFAEEERTRQVPEGPVGKTLAEFLIERPTAGDDVDVPEPDEFDPALMHQEVAVAYHKMRNRMIHREGGYLPKAEEEEEEEEEERVPLTEEEGGDRKVSRFKAARLARLGK